MKKKLIRRTIIIHSLGRMTAGAIVLASLASGAYGQLVTGIASLADNEAQGNGDSPLVGAKISADGRFAAFRSEANNLVANDNNGFSDIFLRDRWSGTTIRISVAHDGSEIQSADCNNPSISSDGRFVTFGTTADNVVPGDTNGLPDVFVRDTQFPYSTTLASVTWNGLPANGTTYHSVISDNGRVVIFRSDATNMVSGGTTGGEVFVRDLDAGTTTLVSAGTGGVEGNGDSGQTHVGLSADGRYACFTSDASNLIVGDTNAQGDIFVRDILLGQTTRVSVTNSGAQSNGFSFSPTISRNGRFVVFTSGANNLVSGDSNNVYDVFVRDTQANTTTRVSVDSSNKQGNARSGGSNNGWGMCGISDDGRYVAFQSFANNLIGNGKDKNNVQDVFVRDRTLGKTTMVSVRPTGTPANGESSGPAMTADGLTVMFCSIATNLVASDTNGKMDVFVRGPAQ